MNLTRDTHKHSLASLFSHHVSHLDTHFIITRWLLGLLLIVFSVNSAQAATQVINSTGGMCDFDGASGGLSVHVGGNSQFQVERCSADGLISKSSQYYLVGEIPPSSSLFNSTFLKIGTTVYGGNTGFASSLAFTEVSNTGGSSLGDGQTVTRYSAVQGGLTYTVTQTVSYVFPNDFYRVRLVVEVPAGNTQDVKLYSWTDIMLDGDDNGSCSRETTFPEYLIADNSAATLYSGYRQNSTVNHWDRYECGFYSDMPDISIVSASGDLSGGVRADNHDVGAAVQWDIGTVSGTTFIADYDFVFSVNQPTLMKYYGPNDGDTEHTISAGDTTQLTFTIQNRPGNPAQGGISFTELLPANISIVGTPIATQCGGSVTKGSSGGRDTLSLSNGSMSGSVSSCTVVVDVTSNTAGVYDDPAGNISALSNLKNLAQGKLTVIAPLAVNCGTESAGTGSGYATGGSGAFRDEIFWLDWSCGATTQFNPGDTVTKSWSVGNGLVVTGTLANITKTIAPYITGTWGGDSLDNLYNGVNPIGLTNINDAEDPSYQLSFTTTLNGVPIAADIVAAEAEDTSGSGESATWITDGDPWQVIEAIGSLDARFSNGGRTLFMSDDPERGGGTVLAVSENVSNINVNMQAGGKEALAFGVFVPFDYSDADGFATSGGHYVAIDASGGSMPTTITPVNSLTKATILYGTDLYLGTQSPDTESGDQPSPTATGDDSDGLNDEDGVAVIPAMDSTASSYALDAVVTNSTGAEATLHAWFDVNGNGSFEVGEYTSVAVANGLSAASVALNWSGLSGVSAGNRFVRLRLTRDAINDNAATSNYDERATVAVSNGEVEDYRVVINAVATFDFGDAPDSYLTLDASGGAKHTLGTDLYIGTTAPDQDADGFVNGTDADGPLADEENDEIPIGLALDDDNDDAAVTGLDDEGGLSFPALTSADTNYALTVAVHNNSGVAATLVGWIDLDGNGAFDADEGTSIMVPNGAVSATLTWASLPGIRSGITYARLRLSTDTSDFDTSTPGGLADNGEVEDYLFTISEAVPASPGEYLCSDSGLYISLGTAGGVNLYDIVTNSSPFTFSTIGFGNDAYNAIGYRLADNLIYGMVRRSNSLVMIDGNGASYLLGAVSGLPVTGYIAGDFANPAGTEHYWVIKRNKLYEINVATAPPSVVSTVTLTQSVSALDIAWSNTDNVFYTIAKVSGGRRLMSINPVSGAVTDISGADIGGGSIGAMFVDSAGRVFGNDNSGAGFYQYNTTTGTKSLISASPGAALNDGAHCVNAPINIYDYADAPDTGAGTSAGNYQTLLADSGPRHFLLDSLKLGNLLTADSDGQQSSSANGDSSDDGVTLPVLTQDETATITVDINGTGGYLQAWIDWNGDGDFLDTVNGISEQISINAQDNTTTVPGRTDDADGVVGQISLAVVVPELATTNQTIARFRWSTVLNLDSTTEASDGEVEDYALSIMAAAGPAMDYGDAPDSYQTLQASNGASHVVGDDVYLGSIKPDAEADGQAGVSANGDGLDEDGVVVLPALNTSDRTYEVTVTVTNTTTNNATLLAWIDFDGNNQFDADEAAIRHVPASTSTSSILVKWSDIPLDIQAGSHYLRLRLTTDSLNNQESGGAKSDGEVEDFPITINTRGVVVSGRVFQDTNVNAISDVSEVGITGLPVVLYDTASQTCRSVRTNGQGDYQFVDVVAGNYQLYEASREQVPVPVNCGPAFAKDPAGYRSTTLNALPAFAVSNSDITGKDFGAVRPPVLEPDHHNQILPGNVLFYAHRFSTPTQGVVSFRNVANGNSTEGWSSVIYQDSDCNGKLNGLEGNAVMNGSMLNATTWQSQSFNVVASGSVCLINKVYAPANVAANDPYNQVITATFDYQNAIAGVQQLQVQDITTAQQVQAPTVPETPAIDAAPAIPAQPAQNATDNTPATEALPEVPSTPYTPATDPTPAQAPVLASPVTPTLGASRLVLRKTVKNITQGGVETETSNQAKPGDTLEYRIYYRNSGTGPITDLVVNDTVPAYTQLLGSSDCGTAPSGMLCTASPLGVGDSLRWNFTGTLNGGVESSVSYQVRVDN